MLNRTKEPLYHNPTEFSFHLPPYTLYTLDNAVPVYAVNTGAEEVMMLQFVFYAGNWFEKKKIVAGTTNFLLKNGTAKRSAFDISEAFDRQGAYLSVACYNETASITLHCLTRNVQDLLPIVAELITESCFPQKELDIYQQNQKQRLAVNLRKSEVVANRNIDAFVYGINHPYGTYNNAEDFDALHTEELKDFFEKYYVHGNCLLFAAGHLPNNIAELLNRNFGHLPLHYSKDPWKAILHPVEPAEKKQYHITNDEKGVQGAIRLARPFPNRHHPDYAAAQLLNTIFGGYFGSRLMSNIREEKGYTYGISSYMQGHMQTDAWVISTEAKREACPKVMEEVWKEAKLLRTQLVGEEELALVRNFLLGSLLSELDGPFQIIARWKFYILNDLQPEYFYQNIDTIKNTKAETLLELARKYLKEEDFYQLTVI